MAIKVLMTGATGMVGQGVIIECLERPEVGAVTTIGRRATGRKHDKLNEIVHSDFLDFSLVEQSFKEIDACFFCLGVSSIGMTEADYRMITVEYAVKLAEALKRQSPDATFCFVSGSGTDSTMKSKVMWARVKGEAENAILGMGFKSAFCFRPGYIQPRKGIVPSYRLYHFLAPIYPTLHFLFPGYTCASDEIGQAMIAATIKGYDKQVLENCDILACAKQL